MITDEQLSEHTKQAQQEEELRIKQLALNEALNKQREQQPQELQLNATSNIISVEDNEDDMLITTAIATKTTRNKDSQIKNSTTVPTTTTSPSTTIHHPSPAPAPINQQLYNPSDPFTNPQYRGATRIVINPKRPPRHPEIFIHPEISTQLKEHQIPAVQFLWDNLFSGPVPR